MKDFFYTMSEYSSNNSFRHSKNKIFHTFREKHTYIKPTACKPPTSNNS